jgi:hypothetical protein
LWRRLTDELDRWSDAGQTATLWWRDDDAVAPSPELDRLLLYADAVELSLSVIPCVSTPSLAARLVDCPSVVVLQHGWAHLNRAVCGKSEYPSSRAIKDVSHEVEAGRRILLDRFGSRALAVFVPPWHSCDDRFFPVLDQAGITHISRKGPRSRQRTRSPLREVNAHVAPVTWTRHPPPIEEEEWSAALVDHLHGRRTGRYDALEHTGLLTHHLVQNERSYDWISGLISVTMAHRAVRWLGGREVFTISDGDRRAHST